VDLTLAQKSTLGECAATDSIPTVGFAWSASGCPANAVDRFSCALDEYKKGKTAA
jgi:hypothetical protein